MSISSFYIDSFKKSIDSVINYHIQTKKYFKESGIGYMGSERTPHAVTFDIIGGGCNYFVTDINKYIHHGKEFVIDYDGIPIVSKYTLTFRVSLMDEDMYLLPINPDDTDYIYIIIPYTPGIYNFMKKGIMRNLFPSNVYKKCKSYEDFTNLYTYLKSNRDDVVRDYNLYYNPYLTGIFGKNTFDIITTRDKVAENLINRMLWNNHPYEKVINYLTGITDVSFTVQL